MGALDIIASLTPGLLPYDVSTYCVHLAEHTGPQFAPGEYEGLRGQVVKDIIAY